MTTGFELITIVKLFLALAGFLLVAHYGGRDRRAVGVLLTFPLLNGIALLTSPDPMRVASAIYPLVIFNSVLFWAAVSSVKWLPPDRHAVPRHLLLIMRVLVWGSVWGIVAYVLTENSDLVPSSPVWFLAYAAIISALVFALWPHPVKEETRAAEPSSANWSDWTLRVALFVFAFICLAYEAQHASDQKWVGMAGGFPLPGIFAIASISVMISPERLLPIRDTVLLGPVLVIPFTWSFGHLVLLLPAGPVGTSVGMVALVAAWVLTFGIVIWVVSDLERRLDRRKAG